MTSPRFVFYFWQYVDDVIAIVVIDRKYGHCAWAAFDSGRSLSEQIQDLILELEYLMVDFV